MNGGDYGDRGCKVGVVVEISVICCVGASIVYDGVGADDCVVLGSCYVGCICGVVVDVGMSDSKCLCNSQVLYIQPLNTYPHTTNPTPQISINLPNPHLPPNQPNINIHLPNFPISLRYFKPIYSGNLRHLYR